MKEQLNDFYLWLGRVRAGVTQNQLELASGTVSYLERNGSRETIVFLHGFSSSKYVWLKLIRRMPRRYRLLAIDLAGHGDSSVDSSQNYSISHYADVLHEALQKLGVTRFHLTGTSLGGLVATHYALQYPYEVMSLGLIAPAGIIPSIPSEFQNLLEEGNNPLIVTSHAEFRNLLRMVFVKPPLVFWPMRSVLADRLIQRSEFSQQLWDDLVESFEDVSYRLTDISMPCFLLWGDQDRILHVSSVQVFQQHLPDVKTIIMKNTGHAPMVENSRQTARLYLWFFKQIGRVQS